jgi:hypothetical protein
MMINITDNYITNSMIFIPEGTESIRRFRDQEKWLSWDLYDHETYGSYRIFRGGSYAEEARICGSTTRRKSFPDFAIEDLGFRLAKSM